MGGWQTIADAAALLAGVVLAAVLTWSAHLRGSLTGRRDAGGLGATKSARASGAACIAAGD
jgi:hypothetical protein